MELVYLWVEDYKNIKKQGFNFSPRFNCEYDEKNNELTIDENKDFVQIFPDNINITAIVGENGSGKTSLISYLGILSKSISGNIFVCTLTENKILEVQLYNEINDIQINNRIFYKYKVKKFKKDKEHNPPKSNFFYNKDFFYHSMSHIDLNAAFQLKKDFYYLGLLDKELIFDLNKYNDLLNENIIYLSIQNNNKLNELLKKLKIAVPNNILAIPKNLFSNKFDEPIMTGDFTYLSFQDILNKIFEYKINILYDENLDKDKWNKILINFIEILRNIQFHNNHPIKKEYLYIQFFIKDIFNLYEKQKNILDSSSDIDTITLYDIKEKIKNIIYKSTTNNINEYLFEYYKNTKVSSYINELMNIFEHTHFQDPQKLYLMNIGNYPYFSIDKLPLKLVESLKKDNYLDIFRFSFFDKNKHSIDYSSGEIVMFDLILKLWRLKQNKNIKKNIVFLIDEMELFLHPEWQKKYFNSLLIIIEELFFDKNFYVYITTHSPFILSDLPKENVIFLKKDENGNCKNVTSETNIDTFGANIHTLLSHGFFMRDGLMGEFAKKKIDKVIKLLKSKKNLSKKKLNFCKSIVSIIGEPILKSTLQNMLDEKMYSKENRLDRLRRKQKELEDEIKIEEKKAKSNEEN